MSRTSWTPVGHRVDKRQLYDGYLPYGRPVFLGCASSAFATYIWCRRLERYMTQTYSRTAWLGLVMGVLRRHWVYALATLGGVLVVSLLTPPGMPITLCCFLIGPLAALYAELDRDVGEYGFREYRWVGRKFDYLRAVDVTTPVQLILVVGLFMQNVVYGGIWLAICLPFIYTRTRAVFRVYRDHDRKPRKRRSPL